MLDANEGAYRCLSGDMRAADDLRALQRFVTLGSTTQCHQTRHFYNVRSNRQSLFPPFAQSAELIVNAVC